MFFLEGIHARGKQLRQQSMWEESRCRRPAYGRVSSRRHHLWKALWGQSCQRYRLVVPARPDGWRVESQEAPVQVMMFMPKQSLHSDTSLLACDCLLPLVLLQAREESLTNVG